MKKFNKVLKNVDVLSDRQKGKMYNLINKGWIPISLNGYLVISDGLLEMQDENRKAIFIDDDGNITEE